MDSPDPVASLTLCEGAQILARVGSELVLGSEVFPIINQRLSQVAGADKLSEHELAEQRMLIAEKFLPQQIELKLLYVDAKRNLPPEAVTSVSERLSKAFDETEVTSRMKELGLSSRLELEEKLRTWGTSLDRERKAFIEKNVAQLWIGEKLRTDDVITHEQLLDYYRAHATEYDHPTRLRWEHLEVSFARHPNKQEAWQLLARMGIEVQNGRPLAEIAKERSEGTMASSGGQHDWLTQGSLKSDVLDDALFSLPVGTLSPILEDETGFHIVRVVEREDAHRTPFEEIQGEIREKIKAEHKQKRLKGFVEQLREEIPVWTVFDQQTTAVGSPSATGHFH